MVTTAERAGLEIGEIRLLGVGLDPHVGRGDQAEGRLRRRQVLAHLQRIDIGHDARDRRQHGGAPQVALRLVDLRLGGEIVGVLLDRRIGVAAELRQGRLGVMLRHAHALARRVEVAPCLVEGRLRGDAALQQVLLTLEARLVEGDVGPGLLDLRLLLAIGRLQGRELVAHRAEIGLGAGQRDLERLLVEREQHRALLDLLAFMHGHVGDDARHVGRHGELAGMDVGVVGRDVAAAGRIDEQCAGQHEDRARGQQHAPQRPGLPELRQGGRCDLVGEAEPPEQVSVSHDSLSSRRPSPRSPWRAGWPSCWTGSRTAARAPPRPRPPTPRRGWRRQSKKFHQSAGAPCR